jgi:hypothetical protein
LKEKIAVEKLWSETGIAFSDFAQIAVMFLLTMLVFFTSSGKRMRWLNTFLLIIFAAQCLLLAVFRPGLNAKLFALLMLLSVLVIEGVTSLKRTSHQSHR